MSSTTSTDCSSATTSGQSIKVMIDSAASSIEGWKPEKERFIPKCGKCAVLGKYCKKHQPKDKLR